MRIPVKFAELHATLFHGGKNHGLKLFSKDGLSLEYDTEEKQLLVTYKGDTTFLPSTSVHNYTPMPEGLEAELAVVAPDPFVPKAKIKAQVSGPHDHVFQGEGAGIKRNK